MGDFHRILLLVWCQMLTGEIRVVSADCPKGCYCDSPTPDTVRAVCSNLQEFPTTFDPSTTQVSIYASDFDILRKEDIDSLPELRWLDITNGSVSQIQENAFEFATHLKTLKVRACPLSHIPARAFSNLSNLTELDLTNDTIQVLNASLFTGLYSLDTLRLEGNQIREIENGVFSDMAHLRRLGFERNYLETISAAMFDGLTGLQLLGLGHNNISRIANFSFVSLPNLKTLYLDFNLIEELSDKSFDGLQHLNMLNLAYNNLAAVPSDSFSDLTNLSDITLDGNLISEIKPEAFQSLSNVQTIQLNNMTSLKTIFPKAFSDVSALKLLHIEDNAHLDSMAEDAIPTNEAPWLKYLYLSDNGFQSLNETIFTDKPGLVAASVDDNPFDCTCQLKWMRKLMDQEGTYPWVKSWQSGRQAPICQTPTNLEGALMYDLFEVDFTCEIPNVVSFGHKSVTVGETASFKALLYEGLPEFYWTTPSGETVLPGDNVTTPEGTLQAHRQILDNHTVSATLDISNATSVAPGTYFLTSYNAAGNVTVPFDLKLLTNVSSGLSKMEWITIFICGTIGIVLGILLVRYFRFNTSKAPGSQNYARFSHEGQCDNVELSHI